MHRRKWLLLIIALLALWYAFCLPRPLFRDPVCYVLEDWEGELLGARIAADGQWRFPQIDSVPEKFREAIVAFEDKRFFSHPGVDVLSIGRAVLQNIRAGKVVSGGSTISMQVIRLARKGKPRNLYEKGVEAVWATRLELRHSKEEILRLYASYAPFGGNVVGLEAAAWRYFGKGPGQLSWGEAAMLAVLPNSPGLIHPGRNRQALHEKRNRLLLRLRERGVIDELTCELAAEEPLPASPRALPRLAPHLLDRAVLETGPGGARIRSTLQADLQRRAEQVLERHLQTLKDNRIHNVAAVIARVETGEVLAYIGNILGTGAEHGEQVDVLTAPRSTGSILKPYLYAHALQEGTILPQSLLPDIPARMSDYNPVNYAETYDGVVPAGLALQRSLNVPFVLLLQRYGLQRFHYQLEQGGITTLRFPAHHYGLPLILGGAEASLWDITGLYASMARTLGHFYQQEGAYAQRDFRPLRYTPVSTRLERDLQDQPPVLSAAAIWQAFEQMRRLQRPNSEGDWESFQSGFPVAWKTGTSFGFRDAWAVGVTPEYALGVWAGNADGEGRPGLVGVRAAAPALFELFDLLEGGNAWFEAPHDEFLEVPVCRRSGYRALPLCPVDSQLITAGGLRAPACPYHQRVHLDSSRQWRVNSSCAAPGEMEHVSWFVLSPVEEHFYRQQDPTYRPLPPLRTGCSAAEEAGSWAMELIYPRRNTEIYVPVDYDGRPSRTVFRAAHRQAGATIHWHLDREFLGATTDFHELELDPGAGEHLLTLVDEQGRVLEHRFRVLAREKK